MPEILQSLSNDLAETVATAGPAVVRVEARDRLPASGIAWPSDGGDSIVVTAHHVVERDDDINIGLPGGQTIPAELVGRDPTTDLSVLRAQSNGLSAPDWAGGDDLRVGRRSRRPSVPFGRQRPARKQIPRAKSDWQSGSG